MTPLKHQLIFCIDDDADDLDLLHTALLSVDPACRVMLASDGKEGLAQLTNLSASGVLPCLIVLDINMPGLNGRETFSSLRAHKALRHVPVVVFSTSDSPDDKRFFAAENTTYMTKPLTYSVLQDVAQKFLAFCDDELRRSGAA